MKDVNDVYATMVGELLNPCEGVENEYAADSYCDRLYNNAWEARQRLCLRLQVEEDPDLELIFDNFCDITAYLCRRMYEYGTKFAEA